MSWFYTLGSTLYMYLHVDANFSYGLHSLRCACSLVTTVGSQTCVMLSVLVCDHRDLLLGLSDLKGFKR
jgi:hypothetical protein